MSSTWRRWSNPHDRITVEVHGTDRWAEVNSWLDEHGFETGDLEVAEIVQAYEICFGRGGTQAVGYSYRFKRRDADRALMFKLTFGGAA